MKQSRSPMTPARSTSTVTHCWMPAVMPAVRFGPTLPVAGSMRWTARVRVITAMVPSLK